MLEYLFTNNNNKGKFIKLSLCDTNIKVTP